ncbi:MAG: MarR family transcriptional regulator [Pseudonocardiales bacterium]|nr:MarR family transcriptional regulator [Pseudonocardiales bacterium]
MSNKTRTRTTATTGTVRARRSVPDQQTTATVRTDTEDKLWAALHAHPNSTAAALSAAARIGKSTAQKILARWAGEGSVTRTPGIAEGGRRAADLWAITDTRIAADDAQDTTDTTDDAVLEKTEPANAAPASAEAAKPADGATQTAGGDGKSERLAPGVLRGMVEDHLRDHPGQEFGPTAIAKALGGKSSGAVSNALDKLIADGTAVKTNEKPRRFTLAPAEQAATPVPTN